MILHKLDSIMIVLNGWIGREFNPGASAQCAAFTRAAWKEAGMPLPVTTNPDDVFKDTGADMANSFAGNEIGPVVEIRDVRAGDIVMFSNTYGDYPPGTITHVGTCVGSNMIVDRPTAAHPVMKRSIFTFGREKIKQIRRPWALTEIPKVNIRVLLVDEEEVQIPCKAEIENDRIRGDLRPICVALGYNIEYNKDKNAVIIRRK